MFIGLDWPDIFMRAWKTFYQAALAILVGVQLTDLTNFDGAVDLGQAAVWAGLVALVSFVNNAVVKPVWAAGVAALQARF